MLMEFSESKTKMKDIPTATLLTEGLILQNPSHLLHLVFTFPKNVVDANTRACTD